MIHPPDVIEKYAPDAVIGALGGGGADDDEDDDDGAAAGGDGYTMEEVQKHVTKGDCWVVLHGEVLNVSNFLSQHPGGELAILTFAGKDATAEFDMIHPPDVIEKYAPDSVIGALGGAAAEDDDEDDDSEEDSDEEEEEEAGGGGYSPEEVAKHTTKEDCWVILAGKEATAEFDMIHPPDVVDKYAPDAVIGDVGAGGGGGKPKKEKKAKKGAKPVI